jgi:rod shape-determining protein MreC
MKTKLLLIALLLLIVVLLLSRTASNTLVPLVLGVINPVKQSYNSFTQDIEDKSQSYIFQKKAIEKLTKENREFKKQLLEQAHYIQQVQNIYELLPDLPKQPLNTIEIVDTISYVKLNSFSQIMLTTPQKKLDEKKIYGLIKNNTVGGTAIVKHNQLYGRLTSNDKCRFSVFIGQNYAPGIAQGYKNNTMVVHFIPSWYTITKGDKVITSGLDNIFFSGVAVGVVTKIETKSAYKIAYIQTYNNVYNPKSFLLITNTQNSLANHTYYKNIHVSSKPSIQPISLTENDTKEPIGNHTTSQATIVTIQQKPKQTSTKKPITQTQQEDAEKRALSMIGISQKPSAIDQTRVDDVEPQEVIEEKVVKPQPNKEHQKSGLDLF